MGFIEKIISNMLPNNRINDKSPRMVLSLGDGDYFSDGSKYKRGISRSGSPRNYNDSRRRINSRNAYEESAQGRAIVRRHVDNIVDSGLVFRSRPNNEILGISKNKIEKFSLWLTNAFHLFMRSKSFSSSETMNGYQFQRHLMTQQLRDGEYFTVFNRKWINKNRQISPLSFQVIDNNQVGPTSMMPYAFTGGVGTYTMTGGFNDYDFDNGIKRDKYCREVSYLVTWKKGKNNNRTEYERKEIFAYLNSGSIRMIHGFVQEYPNQIRGNGILAPVIQELQELLDLDISHIEKAIKHSQMVMASESDGNEDSIDPFENLNVGEDSIIADQDPSTVTSNTTSTNSNGEELTFRQMPEAQIQTPGSISFVGMPPGNKIKLLQSQAPMTGYGEFVENFVSYLAAACDMPIEVLRMKFSDNYSASRATLVLAWRISTIYRKELISDFLNQCLEAFVEMEIALGRIKAPGFSDPLIRSAWLSGNWIGTPMPEIDPLKQMKANKHAVELGAATPDIIAMETNGSDGRRNREENSYQISELSIPPWGSTKG